MRSNKQNYRMNKLLLTLLLTTLSSIITNAQQPTTNVALKDVTINGKVLDKETNEPLEYATIAFFSKKENKIITGGITDIKGEFKISVPTGTYDISIEYISYKTEKMLNKTLSKDEDLGTIILDIDAQSLAAVEVIAERTTVEIKLDKKIYNVGKDLTVRGGTVSDVLDNVPSVSVDVEGNVALRGNDNVRILINGKPSGLVGLNSTDALRQLPAEAIERVEVITSPSSRYDAEGTAGILNIILRRSKLQGLNGAITVNGGYPETAGASGNINYRTGDFNFFNTSGYSYRESPGESSNSSRFFNSGIDDNGIPFDNPDTFLNEERETERIRKGFNTNFGTEWYLNDNTSLTGNIVYRNSDNESETRNNTTTIDGAGIATETFRLDPEVSDSKTIQYGLNFDKQFGEDSSHKLTADFQYENSDDDEFSTITQNGIIDRTVSTIDEQDRFLLQADYVKPIGESSQFEVGYRGSFREQDTDFAVDTIANGAFSRDNNLSNNLVYTENINAVYVQYGSKVKDKFSYLLGLRFEDTQVTVDQRTTNDVNEIDYSSLFPTVNLGYEFTEKQSLTLGYSRRVRRPRSRFINPFPSQSSLTNLFQGNPNLDPSFSNAFDLGYLNRFGKLTLNSSIFYQRSTDVFTFITEDTGTTVLIGGEEIPVIRRTPVNLGSSSRYGFEFTVTYRPTRKWNINGNVNIFENQTRGDFNGTNFDADNFSWFVRLNNKYTLPGGIDWQTRLFYRGPSETAQTRNEGLFSANLAFSKDVFNERGSIALNISDVFNSRKRRSETTTPTFFNEGEFQFRQRSINLSFTYRFNQQKNQRRRNQGNNNGGEEDFEFEG